MPQSTTESGAGEKDVHPAGGLAMIWHDTRTFHTHVSYTENCFSGAPVIMQPVPRDT